MGAAGLPDLEAALEAALEVGTAAALEVNMAPWRPPWSRWNGPIAR